MYASDSADLTYKIANGSNFTICTSIDQNESSFTLVSAISPSEDDMKIVPSI